MPKPPTLTFHGAAGEVTGSCTLVETEHARVLVDFGLFQGAPSQELRNAKAPDIDFRRLNAVVCTHAHIDHCGRMGMLPRLGFDGLLFCTEPTAEILPMVLRSSANLQKVRVDEWRDGTGPDAVVLDPAPDRALAAPERDLEPPVLYQKGDAERLARGIVGVPYGAWRDIAPGIRLRLHDAGHVIGSASVELEIVHGASRVRVLFSGDVGPAGDGYLRPRGHAAEADVVIMESTTGARPQGPPPPDFQAALRSVVDDCRAGARTALLPTFSVGRAQVLVHGFARLAQEGLLEGVPVYLDSPMAIRAAELCMRHPGLLSPAARAMIDAGHSPFEFPGLQSLWSRKHSLPVAGRDGAGIVLAGSGFCDAGPVLHHLELSVGHDRGLVVFTGYVLPGSMAEALAEGRARRVRVNGSELDVRATVRRLHGLSGHADAEQMCEWLVGRGKAPGLVVLNHGDEPAREGMERRVRAAGATDVARPALNATLALA
ncbi:MAG: MBL fold metallo-hydrolase [Planctomycetota bacterium]